MNIASVALVVAALGVNFGWQPSAEDPQAYEVLMQVEPELVDVLAERPADSHRKPRAGERHADSQHPRRRRHRRVAADADREKAATQSRRRSASSAGRKSRRCQHTARLPERRRLDRRSLRTGHDQRQPAVRPARCDDWRRSDSHGQESTLDARRTRSKRPPMRGTRCAIRVNSGIQQTNQQISQGGQTTARTALNNAGSEFGQQLQEMSGFGTQTAPPSAASSAAPSAARSSQNSWPAPPPLASPTSTQ